MIRTRNWNSSVNDKTWIKDISINNAKANVDPKSNSTYTQT